ncbi:MAG TPA: FAD-dependent monooxygenase [Acetobacteraceae bacterium]|nr:FAD-dependent monooxygenase [Acetobacteraceae bacterium]
MPGRGTDQSYVLIIGAGPAGLFAACELARHGVMPRIVERRMVPHHQARATAIQPAGLELLARAGVLEPFIESSIHVRRTRFYAPGFAALAVSSFEGIDCPHEYQCSLPQWRTEEILTEHLQSFGVSVERGTTVLSIDEDADTLDVRLRGPDGEIETSSFGYVLGAGGAHDVTRRSMQESLQGDTYAGQYIVADIQMGLPHEAEESMVFVSDEGFVLLAPLPGSRWLSFVDLDLDSPVIDQRETPELAQLSALLNRRTGVNASVHDLNWASHFVMHKRITRRLADGRRFLMGDAAHLSSPIAGEGLNSALMDAADIAWKLALVVRGAGLRSLLDAYAIERHLADQHVLEVSDMLHRRALALAKPSASAMSPPPDPTRLSALARARGMLDVTYVGSPLVGEYLDSTSSTVVPPTPMTGPSPGARFRDRIRLSGTKHHLLLFGGDPPPDLFRRRWQDLIAIENEAGFDPACCGTLPGGALLVRPDGFIGYRLANANDAGFTALDAHLSTYLAPDRT